MHKELGLERHLLLLDKSPSISCPACSSCPTHSVNILSHVDWSVIANNVRDVADIYATRYEIGAYQAEVDHPIVRT